MSISGINSLFGSSQTTNSAQNRQNLPTSFSALLGAGNGTSSTSSTQTVAQQFSSYVNGTPAQRMENEWLAQHGITQQEFDSMSASQKQKLAEQMQQAIDAKLKQKMDSSYNASAVTASAATSGTSAVSTNILV